MHVPISFIFAINKSLQCKAVREQFTQYQSKDPSPAIPAYRKNEENMKNIVRQKRSDQLRQKKTVALLLKPADPTPTSTGSARSLHTERKKLKMFIQMKNIWHYIVYILILTWNAWRGFEAAN